MSQKLTPDTQAPKLEVQTVAGDRWKLTDQNPENFTMIVFYRGLHCPICQAYLADLERKLDDFAKLGVTAIAISSDPQEKAQQAKAGWGLKQLTVGYGQTVESMRDWGLYISQGEFDYEPEIFGEPGLFLVRPDGRLYYIALNNAPFARPTFDDVYTGLKFILSKNYPTRGKA
ncbi:MAG: AhpC/TSA family protein [Kamptonema sp. SIO4C4]|nr:AhpC/TSA family protein [Kamptonema sp. SIO4C4]